MITCIHCNTQFPLAALGNIANPASMPCPHCDKWTPTGEENSLRNRFEDYREGRRYPLVTAARAMGLANGIYNTANKNKDKISMNTASRKLAKKGVGGDIIWQKLIKGRSHHGYKDESTGAAVVVVENDPNQTFKASIYVVFRGSVGMENDGGAGFEKLTGSKVNVDWRANLDNRMRDCPWAPSPIRMHRGFIDIVGSYRDEVYRALADARNIANFWCGQHHTVIAGHSQGAAHALVFTHWLSYQEDTSNVLCMPFSPPRVGNEHFAFDFNRRIAERRRSLPYDGEVLWGAYLMVRGRDPVSHNQKKAFLGANLRTRHDRADNSMAVFGILGKKSFAERAERDERRFSGDIYFHPKCLVVHPGIFGNVNFLQGLNHAPGLFRNQILKQL